MSDLNSVENIALILEYHENTPIKIAEKIVCEIFDKCGFANLKNRKIYELDKKDIMMIKYFRAYMSNFDSVLIEKPFSMLDKMEDMDRFFELFKLLGDKSVTIADLKSNTYYEDRDVIQ